MNESSLILLKHMESEKKSSSFLKSFMINLFVMVNIGLFLLYWFKGININPYAALSLAGLYLSLVGFIVFILKISHSRSSTLLSIKEDYSKQMLVFEYINKFKKDSDLSEIDVELLGLIMKNRSERERGTSHPYEVILKSIEGSNIQFGSSKIGLGGNKIGQASENQKS